MKLCIILSIISLYTEVVITTEYKQNILATSMRVVLKCPKMAQLASGNRAMVEKWVKGHFRGQRSEQESTDH